MTADFAERAPAAADFVRNSALPNDLVSAMLAWKEENNASADETAAWLLTNHTDVVMAMVNDEAKAKLSKLF